MRILMLGWEFPPFISGGLGTACYGLTRALDRLGHDVIFVLPRAVDRSVASHVELVSPDADAEGRTDAERHAASASASGKFRMGGFVHAEFLGVPASRVSPYGRGRPAGETGANLSAGEREALLAAGVWVSEEELLAAGMDPEEARRVVAATGRPGSDYHGDVVGDSQRYARMVLRLCRRMRFDVIHAHDWMTYPAGMALAQATGRPLVVHIHSTEFDRSGEHVHQRVYDIERRGMHAAMKVIAVSNYTKNICAARYAVDPAKIEVVYNGIECGQPAEGARIESKDRIVLFLGRITMQKGPEYFVAAAKRVLEKMDNVKFVVAGAGDMYRRMVELAAEMGIGHKVLFAGFLRGRDVARVFQMADCYVMPSVSEPFGIAPLEAMSHDVPVIISKQSGVSEVLNHALKVDFWDVDEMANKILAVLRHPPLANTLREHGRFELRKLTWEGAAEKCVRVYKSVVDAMIEPKPGRTRARV